MLNVFYGYDFNEPLTTPRLSGVPTMMHSTAASRNQS